MQKKKLWVLIIKVVIDNYPEDMVEEFEVQIILKNLRMEKEKFLFKFYI